MTLDVLGLRVGGFQVAVQLPVSLRLPEPNRFLPFQAEAAQNPDLTLVSGVGPVAASWSFARPPDVRVWAVEPGVYGYAVDGMQQLRRPGQAAELAVDSAARVALAHHVSSRDGLLLHASGWQRKGQVRVFFGVSGAGKSTTVKGAPPGEYLCDETMLLRRMGAEWRVFGTPFRGSDGRPGSAGGGVLQRLLQLHQVPGPARVERLESALAVRGLMRCVMLHNPGPAELQGALQSVCALVKEGYVATLCLGLGEDPWCAEPEQETQALAGAA